MTKKRPLTEKQKKYIQNKLKGMNNKQAALKAGYSTHVARNTKYNLEDSRGLQEVFIEAMRKAGLSDDILSQVLREGLDATNLNGKDAIEHPDYAVRLAYVKYVNQVSGVYDPRKIDIKSDGKPLGQDLFSLLVNARQVNKGETTIEDNKESKQELLPPGDK